MADRFIVFTTGISRLNKLVSRLKTDGMLPVGLKNSHCLLIHTLSLNGECSFAQLSRECDLDQALVSRVLRDLTDSGHVQRIGAANKYNARYCLTASGQAVDKHIMTIVDRVIGGADQGIDPEDLNTFYRVLARLIENFENMAEDEAIYDTSFPAAEEEN